MRLLTSIIMLALISSLVSCTSKSNTETKNTRPAPTNTQQLAPSEANGFVVLLNSTQPNPVRNCVDAGLAKLRIMRIAQITKKSDDDTKKIAFNLTGNNLVDAQLKTEEALWVLHHRASEVAASKLASCLKTEKFPANDGMVRISDYCYNMSNFSIDIIINKNILKTDPKNFKLFLQYPKLPIPRENSEKFVDEMYAAKDSNAEMALSRELFGSCVNVNNGHQ